MLWSAFLMRRHHEETPNPCSNPKVGRGDPAAVQFRHTSDRARVIHARCRQSGSGSGAVENMKDAMSSLGRSDLVGLAAGGRSPASNDVG